MTPEFDNLRISAQYAVNTVVAARPTLDTMTPNMTDYQYQRIKAELQGIYASIDRLQQALYTRNQECNNPDSDNLRISAHLVVNTVVAARPTLDTMTPNMTDYQYQRIKAELQGIYASIDRLQQALYTRNQECNNPDSDNLRISAHLVVNTVVAARPTLDTMTPNMTDYQYQRIKAELQGIYASIDRLQHALRS
ncbi:hypothetical protein CT694_36075 (plasmid) [Bacillus wiedmannii bv. thuringiensis]|nr:hypothetical protein CT694_36075 [Bacillus wiedmannii bv. thuringiensis]